MKTPSARLALCGLLAFAGAPALLVADDAPASAPAEATSVAAPTPAPDATPAATTDAAAAGIDLAAQVADLKRQLAETEDKLSTSLRSYTLLQNEADSAKDAADKQLAASQAEAAKTLAAVQAEATRAASESAAQVTALSDELRQTQAQANALAAQVADLKMRLAVVGQAPGSALAVPTRPAVAVTLPAPVAVPAADTPPAEAAPRQHIVVAGDTLAKISQRYYGTPNRWDEIFRANRNILQHENLLPVGAALKIP